MWNNLLSGTIGAVIGVLGAFLAALFAVRLTRREDSRRARAEYALRVSGDLAARLVELYDELRRLTTEAIPDDQQIELEHLRRPAGALRRAITVDAPMLPGDLEETLKQARHMIAEVVPRDSLHTTAGDVRRLLEEIRPAGDRLKDLRRDWYQSAPHGMKLTQTATGENRPYPGE